MIIFSGEVAGSLGEWGSVVQPPGVLPWLVQTSGSILDAFLCGWLSMGGFVLVWFLG